MTDAVKKCEYVYTLLRTVKAAAFKASKLDYQFTIHVDAIEEGVQQLTATIRQLEDLKLWVTIPLNLCDGRSRTRSAQTRQQAEQAQQEDRRDEWRNGCLNAERTQATNKMTTGTEDVEMPTDDIGALLNDVIVDSRTFQGLV